MNSAYDNSALRSELTRHSARPPVGGIYSVGMTQKSTSLDRGMSIFTYYFFTIHFSLKPSVDFWWEVKNNK